MSRTRPISIDEFEPARLDVPSNPPESSKSKFKSSYRRAMVKYNYPSGVSDKLKWRAGKITNVKLVKKSAESAFNQSEGYREPYDYLLLIELDEHDPDQNAIIKSIKDVTEGVLANLKGNDTGYCGWLKTIWFKTDLSLEDRSIGHGLHRKKEGSMESDHIWTMWVKMTKFVRLSKLIPAAAETGAPSVKSLTPSEYAALRGKTFDIDAVFVLNGLFVKKDAIYITIELSSGLIVSQPTEDIVDDFDPDVAADYYSKNKETFNAISQALNDASTVSTDETFNAFSIPSTEGNTFDMGDDF